MRNIRNLVAVIEKKVYFERKSTYIKVRVFIQYEYYTFIPFIVYLLATQDKYPYDLPRSSILSNRLRQGSR